MKKIIKYLFVFAACISALLVTTHTTTAKQKFSPCKMGKSVNDLLTEQSFSNFFTSHI
jgi:hypothetical protein